MLVWRGVGIILVEYWSLERYREANEKELLVDLSLREGEVTCCLVHM